MRRWTDTETLEWLLRRVRDEGAVAGATEPSIISLAHAGSDREPPGALMRQALVYALEQGIERPPGGWVRLVGEADPRIADQVTLYITDQGLAALAEREHELARDPAP